MTRDDQLHQLFELAVDENADAMFRVAYRLTGERDWATELVQETYLQAWQGLESLREPSRLQSWMFGILHRQYLKQLRRKTRLKFSTFDEGNTAEVVTGDAESVVLDRRERVQQAIQQLSDDHRLPILLVSMEGVSVEQAAEILEWPRGTVLSRLHRGRQRLKEILERHDITN
jgi:RNA polymerase sigma-70 factor, ECF subfamily